MLGQLRIPMANRAIREVSPFLQGWGDTNEGVVLPQKGGRNGVRDCIEVKVYRPGPDVLGKLLASDVLCFGS